MFSRVALRSVARPLARSFSVQAPARKDFIQDLYVKELKAYKPSANAASSAGAVKSYSTPAAPQAPAVPDAAALASELEAYDAEVVSQAAAPVAAESAVESEDGAEGADEYLKLVEADVKHEAKH